MAYIEERKTKDGKTHFRALVRLKGYPKVSATFDRITDAKKWTQQTESAMREGRYFRTAESKKHTLADLIDRYIEHVVPIKPRQRCCQNGATALVESRIRILPACRSDACPHRRKKRYISKRYNSSRQTSISCHCYTLSCSTLTCSYYRF